MWAVSQTLPAPTHFLYRPTTQTLRPFLRTQPRSAQPKNDGVYEEDTGGKQLSGSDVLWALQRAAAAAATKKKKNKKKREVSSADTHREYDDVDYSNVKPLCIKSEWAVKLDEFEKRLQELSDFI